jgi:carbohydrate-selective porin OprB
MRFELSGRSCATFTPFWFALILSGLVMPLGCHAETSEAEDTTARVQLTYNWQKHPAYQAAYSGPNSIISSGEKMYTFTMDAYLGFRPWKDGEIYLTPEISLGVPFSTNLVGLGGFTNGEITRAAGTNPTLYRQKLFLRQIWNNGGGIQHVEANLNQLAGSIDKNRFVLTVGNFSTLDVFDPNTYAKDPRTQFMNWSNWTYAAYDYAADARGFGWGFAAEWYHEDWALRFGRMTGPKDPNGLPLDYALGKHYGDQFEIEHAHTLYERPGKVRMLGWRNRARLASFDDALAWLNTHPGPHTGPDAIYAVRGTDKIKYGLGVNVEQEISDSTGFFLRAMQADGRTETYAFTEVDGSISSGFTIKGNNWGRGEDAIGLSLACNTLSNERRRFLEAGGISFFIGDGKLNYRAETIFEVYYSLNLGKSMWLTTDYQRIQNPAYNADRGPIDVYAVRFHAEL